MPSIILKDARFECLKLERSWSYPRQAKIILRAKYNKAIINTNDNEEIEMKLGLGLGVYILRSEGYLRFEPTSGGKRVEVRCSVKDIYNPNVMDLYLISEPLSLEEIYEIEEHLSQEYVNISWSVSGWGFLDKPENYGIQPGTLINIYISSHGDFTITRQDFIRRILEPADLLKRRFIEVIVEPINTDELDKIPDEDVRESLKLLLNKQRLLQDALDRLVRANRSSDYRSVIEDVRNVVEGLTLGTPEGARLFSALEKAFKGLGVIEADPSALDEAVKELLDTIKDISKGAFGYSSVFKHTITATSKLHYNPKPYKHDAEFAVLQTMTFLNYLIKVLKVYTQRL